MNNPQPSMGRPRAVVLILALPFMMAIINGSMFRVAFPAMRAALSLDADVTAWLDTAYTLAFLAFMPVYGRLADQLGKRVLFLYGIGIFTFGTLMIALSPGLPLLFGGRIIQGLGSSGIHALCIASISDTFPAAQRGDALGQWNSYGTVAAMAGPLTGGFLIDAIHWRAILLPVLVLSIAAFVVIARTLPREKAKRGAFDVTGFVLLAGFLSLFVAWLSSRPLTGAPPFTDWRLLVGAAIMLALFLLRETRIPEPLVSLKILRYPGFTAASLSSGMRMLLFGGFGILVPLFMSEVMGISTTVIGVTLTGHCVFLLVTMRLGGRIADRSGSRLLAVTGALVQALVMIYLGFPGVGRSFTQIAVALVFHGLAAGLYLAPVHRAALAAIPSSESGAAAGLYSLLRYSGSLIGPALAGVVLQSGLTAQTGTPVIAYQRAFLVIGLVGLVGLLPAMRVAGRGAAKSRPTEDK